MKGFYAFILVLILLLCGCEPESVQYPLRQPSESIQTIELLKDMRDISDIDKPVDFSVLYSVPEAEIMDFIEAFSELRCAKSFGDCPTEFGVLAIRITYDNGDVEIVGTDNNGYFTATKSKYGTYYFDKEEFYNFFARYVDESTLPDIY